MDRTETYRGFRSTAIGISVLVVLVGAWLEKTYVAEPTMQVDRYLTIWFSVAIVSVCIAGVEMLIRSRISKNQLVNKMHWSLFLQMLPCLVVGFVLTLLIADHSLKQPSHETGLLWTLPGIWSMIYALGLFSCYRQFPAQATSVATYILLAGILILVFNWKTRSPAGWQMIASFGVGQFLLGSILFWNVERRRGEES